MTVNLAECGINRYSSEADVCEKCDQSCENCSGPNPSDCISCSAGHGPVNCGRCHAEGEEPSDSDSESCPNGELDGRNQSGEIHVEHTDGCIHVFDSSVQPHILSEADHTFTLLPHVYGGFGRILSGENCDQLNSNDVSGIEVIFTSTNGGCMEPLGNIPTFHVIGANSVPVVLKFGDCGCGGSSSSDLFRGFCGNICNDYSSCAAQPNCDWTGEIP